MAPRVPGKSLFTAALSRVLGWKFPALTIARSILFLKIKRLPGARQNRVGKFSLLAGNFASVCDPQLFEHAVAGPSLLPVWP
jgi:hypothetical protein